MNSWLFYDVSSHLSDLVAVMILCDVAIYIFIEQGAFGIWKYYRPFFVYILQYQKWKKKRNHKQYLPFQLSHPHTEVVITPAPDSYFSIDGDVEQESKRKIEGYLVPG